MLKSLTRFACALALLAGAAGAAAAQPAPFKPATQEGDAVIRDFRFGTGETLPEVRIHYTTLGTPRRDAAGRVVNAVMILHGTGGTGHQFLAPQFADVLFRPGGLLDPAKYYIILPDDVGHGKSSKPSDGLHARFPKYGYEDMVELERRMLVDGLHVDHLRLILGTSMGCMHAFMWGEEHPDSMDALAPFACAPVQIAGRNRMWRKMLIDAIMADPAWMGGEYKSQPLDGLRTASDLMLIAGSTPLPFQIAYPTRDAADARVAEYTKHGLETVDANDLLYAVGSSRDYDPSAGLEKIKAPVLWINSADDFINPPELAIAEKMVKRIPQGRFVLIPTSENTHGHGSHTWAVLWQDELADLLKRTERK
jgi:homoserine O-acetyltransferase